MESKNLPASGFRVLNIFLVECEFFREMNISFEPEKKTTNAEVDSSYESGDNQITITLTLNYSSSNIGGKNEITAYIKMLGIFEKYGENPVALEDFGKINGPAILFPFLREQLASLSLKAGVGAILLPPINFVKKAAEQKEKVKKA